MAFSNPFLKITCEGNLSGVDIFNFSINASSTNATESDILVIKNDISIRNDIVQLLQQIHASQNGSAPFAELERVKFAYIGTDGKYFADADVANFAPLAGGYTDGADSPAFTGSAISLSGAIGRAPAGHGRFYPPANAAGSIDGFYIGTTRQNQLATAWAGVLGDINDILITRANLLHVVNLSEKGAGSMQAVEYVRVGSVLDVQRRRKNRAYETYVNVNIP